MTAPPSGHAHPRVLADRFELRHVLGTGGMATVWSAYDRRLGRTVAVKQLRDDLSEAHADRIRREARAAARIEDPRVVTVLDLEFDADGTPFLVLEAHDGDTLADELRRGPLPTPRVRRLVDDLLGALGAAHRCGVLHRDIKPSNLLVAGDGYRLTDFGIASLDDETATHGDLMGTLVYLAPERFDGAPATPRSDVFAAAAVLYEALTGRQPFRGTTAADSLERLRAGRFDPLADDVPRHLVEAIGRALDPEPANRPADATEFARLVAAGGVPDTTAPMPSVGHAPARTVVVPAPPHVDQPTVALPGSGDVIGADRTDVVPEAPQEPARVPRRTVGDLQHDPRVERVGAFLRRPQVLFIGVAVAILLALLIAAAVGGGDGSPARGDRPDERLEQHLDRIEEIGR